jgi:hypothetical protein
MDGTEYISHIIAYTMDYSKMTKAELIALCKERGIKGCSKKKKKDLIVMLSSNTTSPIREKKVVEKDEKDETDDKDEKYETDEKEKMTNEEYDYTISEIKSIAKMIGVEKGACDGRIDSAMKEKPFLEELEKTLLERNPKWNIVISRNRASCDIIINTIQINLKLTDCKTSDNCVNKPYIYYSITGLTTYPYSSNWNDFLDRLSEAKKKGQIKRERHKPTEYHYLVKNKVTGDVLLKPIFDIYNYVPNASNDLQINWKNEFAHSEYQTEEADYLKKVEELLRCIQKSVKEMIERTIRFAEADVGSLLTSEEEQ